MEQYMGNELITDDVPVIKEFVQELYGSVKIEKIERLGGMTNHTYRVVLEENKSLVIRIPGEGTEEIINRKNEKVSTELAVRLGIDARLYYFEEKGRKVTEYVENAVTMNAGLLKDPFRIQKAAEIFRRLHTCNEDTEVPFEVFDMAAVYEKFILDNEVALFEDYADIKSEINRIKSEMDKEKPPEKVPCHNDPLCENWIEGNGRLYLIDWEYAGMNDGMWDLADLSIEAGYGPAEEELLLRSYFGREATVPEKKSFLANKLYIDYLWTLWGLTRVPFDGQEMLRYAQERYDRLHRNLALLAVSL